MVSSGYLSLLYSVGKKPLEYWSKQCSKTGRIRKTLDGDLLENVVELQDLEKSSNGNTLINCPSCPRQLLDVRLPFLIIIMKNMNVECCFQVQIIDTDDIRHHFNFCTEGFQSNDNIKLPIISRVKLKLESGWNRVEIDLKYLTQRAFNSEYKATQRLAICANCRLRRIYFLDRHYTDMEISPALCQAFFHYCMMKWGIHLPKGTSQMDESYSDVRMTEPATRQTNKDITDSKQVNHYQFLRELRLKSGKLMNDFFRRTNRRLSDKLDFKNKLKLMLFAVPSLKGEGTLTVAIKNNAHRKSKRRVIADASYRETPTRNRENSNGDGLGSAMSKFPDNDRMEVDQCKQKRTDAKVTLDDDWHFRYHLEEPCRINPVMTRVSNEKRIQRPRKQDRFTLKNRKDSPNGGESLLIAEKLISDKRAVKTTVSNAKPKGDARFEDVLNLKGTLDAIRETSVAQKPRRRNRTRMKLVEIEKQHNGSFSKRNFTRECKNSGAPRPRTVTKVSPRILSYENELESVSCNKNCPKVSKEPEISRVQERGCQSVIRKPLSLEIKPRTKRRRKREGFPVESKKISS